MTIKNIQDTKIPGIKIIIPEIYNDDRGYFFESYNINEFKKLDLHANFVQDNQAFSKKGSLRGLHYQLKHPQGKLVRVIKGEVFDIAVDIRQNSPTFGKYVSAHLSDKNNKMMYISEGFAHGYLVLSDTAIFQYKCTNVYHPEDEYGVVWNDKDIKIKWPTINPILSNKDSGLPTLNSINKKYLPSLIN